MILDQTVAEPCQYHAHCTATAAVCAPAIASSRHHLPGPAGRHDGTSNLTLRCSGHQKLLGISLRYGDFVLRIQDNLLKLRSVQDAWRLRSLAQRLTASVDPAPKAGVHEYAFDYQALDREESLGTPAEKSEARRQGMRQGANCLGEGGKVLRRNTMLERRMNG
jgi:hypothetical protein